MKATVTAFALSFLFLTACEREEQQPKVVVFSANGDINPELDRFRSQLGVLNTTPGHTTGRREINWDGVPEEATGIPIPGDFFNATAAAAPVERKRGLIYGGDADAIVSKTAFAEVNPQAAGEFSSFSGNRSFAVVNSTVWPVEFRVAGQATTASVQGFGAVFTDVDRNQSTFIECFNGNQSLGKYYVPVQNGGNKFSFLGIWYQQQRITHVHIGHEGKLSDGGKDITQGGDKDLIVLDNFIYSEPLGH
jgi:hypothetical protein